ncbi:hypothetical protein MTQ28_23375, partial [Escherichia coli]|nr:hypothetical protein [Escherichia coli]
ASCGSDPNECDWVSVDNDGKVTFDGDATTAKKTVTITATPKNGGAPLTYTFTVSRWFTNLGASSGFWDDTNTACTDLGLSIPEAAALASGVQARGTGALRDECGKLSRWPESLWEAKYYWAADELASPYRAAVNMDTGAHAREFVFTTQYGVCVRGL